MKPSYPDLLEGRPEPLGTRRLKPGTAIRIEVREEEK